MRRFADVVDRLNAAIGRAVAWLILAAVLVQLAVVVLRYVFGLGSVALQESVVYAHAVAFMLAAAWTLARDEHVRVDLFYRKAGPRGRAAIDLAGALALLLPFAVMLLILAAPYVDRSWTTLESSRDAAGLPAVFLLKTVILVFAAQLALQGLALATRAAAVLSGR